MKTTVEALKDLYGELGGSSSTVKNIVTIPDMIEAIAALIKSGATKELPAVTADDNGDVLTVVEGAWTNAAPSGGDAT